MNKNINCDKFITKSMKKLREGESLEQLRFTHRGRNEISLNCFFFDLFRREWYRANSKHLIIFDSSSFFFCENGTGPTQNI